VDWERLGAEVETRRGQLGYSSREEFQEATDFAAKTLGDVENARRANYGRGTLARLEAALRWPRGAVDAILRGEPAPPDLAAALPPYTVPGALPLSDPARQVQAVMDSGLPAARKADFARAVLALVALATGDGEGPTVQQVAVELGRAKARDALGKAREDTKRVRDSYREREPRG
jgi:hypothetical protein